MNASRPRARRPLILAIVFLALLGTFPAAADQTIHRGDDYWQTSGAGSTFTSFEEDPIPADFFCPGSPPFTGTIALEGSPLATDPPGFLGSIDTIVRRLDDATFDEQGVASTRIQLLALSLASPEPIDVGCESRFDVAVSLAGEQPKTEMKILRQDEDGGTYVAPLALRVRLAFTPADGGETLGIDRDVRLGPGTNSVWATHDRVGTTAWGEPVLVDTDGDRVAEAVLGPANFAGSILPAASGGGPSPSLPACTGCYSLVPSCHCNPNSTDPNEDGSSCSSSHLHCVWVCVFTGCMY